MSRYNIFILFFTLTAGISFISCDNNSNDDFIQALTEDDFANDLILSADPSGGVVVTFLEHPDDPDNENQTGDAGIDIIPIRYDEDANHTFCWEDSSDQSEHFLTFNRINGDEIFKVEANGDCVTQTIEQGIYELVINHDGLIDKTFPVFIQNSDDGDELSKFAGRMFLFEAFKTLRFTKSAKAQDVSANYSTLINTNSCEGCNLTGAGLSFKDLSGADLNGANLSFSQMIETNLTGADLSDSNLNNANLTGANLTNADISGASTENTELSGADLTGINI